MPEIKSFKGVFFNQEKVNIEQVVTPPYDVISKRMQEDFYNKSDYNIVRLIFGKEYDTDDNGNNKYIRAAEFLNQWISDEILVFDKKEAIYYLEETFFVNGEKKVRKGFISLSKLEDFSKGNILPHEKTMHGPKADRLNLTKHCKCNFSQIFSVYSDENCSTMNIFKNATPFLNFEYNGTEYKLGKITDKSLINKLAELMKNKKIFIADGHHRYETALAYKNYRREIENNPRKSMPYDYVMMYFSPIEENDLLILPTHRGVKNVTIDEKTLIENLSDFFQTEKFTKNSIDELLKKMKKLEKSHTVFGAYFGSENLYFLKFKNSLKEKLDEYASLDVQILQSYILEKFLGISQEDLDNKTKIEYIKDIEYGFELIANNELQGIFLMNPTKINQVKNIALSGKKMPQKSTYFYPKLLTGLVIYKIE